jgi:hypothetical protein
MVLDVLNQPVRPAQDHVDLQEILFLNNMIKPSSTKEEICWYDFFNVKP